MSRLSPHCKQLPVISITIGVCNARRQRGRAYMVKIAASKSSYCRQVAIYAVRPSRSETTGANDPGHPCSSDSLVAFVRSLRDLASQGCSQQAESYGQALSISRSHSSLYPLIVAIIILSRRQKHKAWSNGLRKQYAVQTCDKETENGEEWHFRRVASKLQTFLGTASTFGHLLDTPQSPTMLCASCLVTNNLL